MWKVSFCCSSVGRVSPLSWVITSGAISSVLGSDWKVRRHLMFARQNLVSLSYQRQCCDVIELIPEESRWLCAICFLWLCWYLQLGSVGGARWRLEEELSHDKVVPSLIGGSCVHHLKPDFDKRELLPRLLSHSLFPGLAGVCVAGQVDRFGNSSCACLGLCLLYGDVSWVGPDGILAGISPMNPMEKEDRTFN